MKPTEFNKLATSLLSQNLQNFTVFIAQKHNISEQDLKTTIEEFLETHKVQTSKKIKKKVKKDVNAPKKPSTSFIHFSNIKRKDLSEKGMSFKDIGKELGEQWRNLNEKDKKKYQKMAEDDKKRFEDEMKNYKSAETSTSPVVKKIKKTKKT